MTFDPILWIMRWRQRRQEREEAKVFYVIGTYREGLIKKSDPKWNGHLRWVLMRNGLGERKVKITSGDPRNCTPEVFERINLWLAGGPEPTHAEIYGSRAMVGEARFL